MVKELLSFDFLISRHFVTIFRNISTFQDAISPKAIELFQKYLYLVQRCQGALLVCRQARVSRVEVRDGGEKVPFYGMLFLHILRAPNLRLFTVMRRRTNTPSQLSRFSDNTMIISAISILFIEFIFLLILNLIYTLYLSLILVEYCS